MWKKRTTIYTTDFDKGTGAIYDLYLGTTADRIFNLKQLTGFINALKNLARGYHVIVQGLNAEMRTENWYITTHGNTLWADFFHVLSTPQPAAKIRTRVYIHASDAAASLEIMEVVVDQFQRIKGLWEVNTCGPGSNRLDTIVAYLYDDSSRDTLVKVLGQLASVKPNLFADPLPPLIKRLGTGIGVADEPPAVEIFQGGGARHSFGSFFSTLAWIALKYALEGNPNSADGRHMLDNLLYSLRVLRVEPKNPQYMPAANELEIFYKKMLP